METQGEENAELRIEPEDRYGQSWQIVPTIIPELFQDHESATAQRAMEAMLKMKKLDIAELERAGGKERAAHS